MSNIVKSYVQLIGVGMLLISAVFWMPNRHHPDLAWLFWLVRVIGLPLSIGLLVYTFKKPPKDIIPDYLHRNFKYRCVLERDGLCFVVAHRMRGGLYELLIYYQNRFDRMCVATIDLRGVPGFFQITSDLEPVTLNLRVGGGEYGVASIPYAVPADRRGKRISLFVSANVIYPAGKGNMLRFMPGISAGLAKFERKWTRDFWNRVGLFRGLKIKLRIPVDAPDVKQAGASIGIDILDQPSFSSGFEVIPVAKKEEK